MVYSIFTRGSEGTWHTVSRGSKVAVGDKDKDQLLSLLVYLRIKGIITLDGIIYDNKIEWKKEEEEEYNNNNHGAHDPFGDVGADVGLESAKQKLPDWARIEVIRWRRPEYRFFFYSDQWNQASKAEDEYQVLCIRLEDKYKVPVMREFIKDPDNSIVPDNIIAEYSRISVSTVSVLKEIGRIIKEEDYGDEYSVLLEDNNMVVREQVGKKLLSYYIEYSKEIMSKVRKPDPEIS